MLGNFLTRKRVWLLSSIVFIAGASALFSLVALRARSSSPALLVDRFDQAVIKLTTVKGRLEIRFGGVILQQELWIRHPGFLRTETEAGPSAFAGTIVVLNDQEGWVFSSALNMATVVNRSDYSPGFAGEAGAGSLLERMPDIVNQALHANYPTNQIGKERVAGRQTTHLEIVIPHGEEIVPPGILQVWIDDEFAYPLAWQDSLGREMKFTSVLFNQDIDPAIFTFIPPPSASVRRVRASN